MTAPTVEDRVRERRERVRNANQDATPRITRIEVEKPLIDDVPSQPVSKAADDTEPKKLVYRPGVLVKPLTGLYEMVGGFIILADPDCGTAVINSAEDCAKSLDDLAKTNPKVRKVLMRMVESGAVTKVIIAHLPILLAVMAHHFPNALKYVAQIFLGAQRLEAEGAAANA